MYFLRRISLFTVLTLAVVSPRFSFATDAIVPSKAYVDDTFVNHSGQVGSATQPVYVASDGTATATTYTLGASVPANAVFTDTQYTGSDGVALTGTNFTNSGVRSVATGTTAGTVAVNTNGTTTDVAVNGFGDKQTKPATVANGQVLTYIGNDANTDVTAGYVKLPVAAGAPSTNTPTSFVEVWIQ